MADTEQIEGIIEKSLLYKTPRTRKTRRFYLVCS